MGSEYPVVSGSRKSEDQALRNKQSKQYLGNFQYIGMDQQVTQISTFRIKFDGIHEKSNQM